MNFKYSWLPVLFVGLVACDVNNDLDAIPDTTPNVPEVALTAGSADFSKYVAIGASFTAGFTDGALFKAGQENSFPNILASKFKMANGGDFTQPLMEDNIGGFLIGGAKKGDPRFYFNGAAPTRLADAPTTEITNIKTGPYNNMGVPGIKSFHLGVDGYGALAALPNANPYFIRMASTPTTSIIKDVIAQTPTFFSLSEIGGNDVLDYAVNGGYDADKMQDAVYQENNLDPKSYGSNDITSPLVFGDVYTKTINALTAGGAKGVVATVPYITSLPHFTRVPHNPLDPKDPNFGPQIPTLNNVFSSINGVFTAIGVPERSIVFATDAASPVVIKDESLDNKTTQIITALLASPTFPPFVANFGLPTDPATLQKVAGLLGTYYGQARPATKDDLFVLPSSAIIGKVNNGSVAFLMGQGLPQQLAGMFSVEGVSLPLEDKWVLTATEVGYIKTATDAYNTTIKAVAGAKGLAIVDFGAILEEASTNGLPFGDYTMTTSLVFGGLVSLDGIHLTARGYALMANKMLEAIDTTYGSNFKEATNGLTKADNYQTNYSPALK